jgi:hypothetical protein
MIYTKERRALNYESSTTHKPISPQGNKAAKSECTGNVVLPVYPFLFPSVYRLCYLLSVSSYEK